MIIQRPNEIGRILEMNKWILVYGRRKSGKSFLIENFMKYDDYFFIKRDRSVISKKDDSLLSYETFLEVLKRSIAEGKTVIVDEFHRLGEDFFDFLHSSKKQGKVVLVSSTLFLSKRLISERSPLLGLFAEIPIGLIGIRDSVAELKKLGFDNKSLVELAILIKEPLAIDYLGMGKQPRRIIANVLSSSAKTIPALIGEVFVEEERSMSASYEAILRAIANGHIVSSEISSYLFSRKLIQKDDPSIIQQYLNNLVGFGIIRRLQIYGKNRFIYKHVSPLARLFYYADEKHNISEKTLSDDEMGRLIDELVPKIVEDEIRWFLSSSLGLGETVLEAKDFDIDICLTRFKRCEVAVEVKWKEKIGKEDIRRAEEVLHKIEAKRRLLFVPDKRAVKMASEEVEIVDIMDFIA